MVYLAAARYRWSSKPCHRLLVIHISKLDIQGRYLSTPLGLDRSEGENLDRHNNAL